VIFLLAAALILVALAAPVVLVFSLAFVAVPARRVLGLTMLRAGLVGAALCLGLIVLVNALENSGPPLDGLLLGGGLGFTLGAVGFPLFEVWDSRRGG
jgi:hypothetical protein